MNLEEAIKTSIEYENKVKACYDEALEEVTDETAKKVYEAITGRACPESISIM